VVGSTLVALARGPPIGLLVRGDPYLFDLVTVVGACTYLRGCLGLLDSVAGGCRPTFLLSLDVRHVHDISQDLLVVSRATRLVHLLSVLWRANSEAGDGSHVLMALTRFRDALLVDNSDVSTMLLLLLCGLLL
jgi:hypothetical protein